MNKGYYINNVFVTWEEGRNYKKYCDYRIGKVDLTKEEEIELKKIYDRVKGKK